MTARAGNRPAPLRGLDPWRDVDGLPFTRWDQWFLAILVADCGGDWDRLREKLRERRKGHGFERNDAEVKLSHLDDLRRRVEGCGRPLERVVRDVDGRLLRKARTKLLEQSTEEREKTRAMRETPRHRLGERALRGHWSRFPLSPARFEALFEEEVESRDFYTERASFGLSRRLEGLLEREGRRTRSDVRRLALHRAFLTALIDAMHRTDDSCGVMGDLFGDALEKYFQLPWQRAGIEPEAYYGDFLEFATWEDYGLTWRRLGQFFASVAAEQVELVEAILRQIRQELLEHELDYQAERALTLLGELHVAKRSVDRFVTLASEMGSREWERITTMAEAAWRARRRDLALAVFAAADQPGFHRDYLRKRCEELTGQPPPRPRLALAR